MADEFSFTINVKDPDAMVAWAEENLEPGSIHGVTGIEADTDDGVQGYFEMTIMMSDPRQATLLKTFWAKA